MYNILSALYSSCCNMSSNGLKRGECCVYTLHTFALSLHKSKNTFYRNHGGSWRLLHLGPTFWDGLFETCTVYSHNHPINTLTRMEYSGNREFIYCIHNLPKQIRQIHSAIRVVCVHCILLYNVLPNVHQSQPLTDLIKRLTDELKNHFSEHSTHTILKIRWWKISLNMKFHSVLSQMHQIFKREKIGKYFSCLLIL